MKDGNAVMVIFVILFATSLTVGVTISEIDRYITTQPRCGKTETARVEIFMGDGEWVPVDIKLPDADGYRIRKIQKSERIEK